MEARLALDDNLDHPVNPLFSECANMPPKQTLALESRRGMKKGSGNVLAKNPVHLCCNAHLSATNLVMTPTSASLSRFETTFTLCACPGGGRLGPNLGGGADSGKESHATRKLPESCFCMRPRSYPDEPGELPTSWQAIDQKLLREPSSGPIPADPNPLRPTLGQFLQISAT